jgi:hypothetical protein
VNSRRIVMGSPLFIFVIIPLNSIAKNAIYARF